MQYKRLDTLVGESNMLRDHAELNPGIEPVEVTRAPDGKWLPGIKSPNTGKRKRIREIEDMLDEEFRTLEDMRRVFTRLRALAMGQVIEVLDKKTGAVLRIELKSAPEYMKMYLERLLGPVKDPEIDFEKMAPPVEVLDWITKNLA